MRQKALTTANGSDLHHHNRTYRWRDWLKKNTTKTGQVVLPEVLEWSGVAVIKEAYRIYKEKREDIQQDCLAQQTEMFTTGV